MTTLDAEARQMQQFSLQHRRGRLQHMWRQLKALAGALVSIICCRSLRRWTFRAAQCCGAAKSRQAAASAAASVECRLTGAPCRPLLLLLLRALALLCMLPRSARQCCGPAS